MLIMQGLLLFSGSLLLLFRHLVPLDLKILLLGQHLLLRLSLLIFAQSGLWLGGLWEQVGAARHRGLL